MSASHQGHVKVVDTLIQHGAKVDWKKEVNTYFVEFFCHLNSCYISIVSSAKNKHY